MCEVAVFDGIAKTNTHTRTHQYQSNIMEIIINMGRHVEMSASKVSTSRTLSQRCFNVQLASTTLPSLVHSFIQASMGGSHSIDQ